MLSADDAMGPTDARRVSPGDHARGRATRRKDLPALLHRAVGAGNRWLDSRRGRSCARLVRNTLTTSLLAWLGWQIYGIGWREICRQMPTSPAFYLLFLVLFVQLPIAKTLTYRLSWKFDFSSGLVAMFKSTIYDREVGAISGDVFLYRWAHQRLRQPSSEILRGIKDFSIVAWICGTLWVFALTAACHWLVVPPELQSAGGWDAVLLVGGVALGLVATVVMVLHRLIFWLPHRQLYAAAALCFARLGLASLLVMLQWSMALPEVSWLVWCRVLTMRAIIQWLPWLPNHQVLVCVAGIRFADRLGLPAEQLAGVLFANTVLEKGLTLFLMSGLGLRSFARGLPKETRHTRTA